MGASEAGYGFAARFGRRLAVYGALLMAAAYLCLGPQAVRAFIGREAAALIRSVSSAIESVELNSMAVQIESGSEALRAAIEERVQLQATVEELQANRGRLLACLAESRSSTRQVVNLLGQANAEGDVLVGDRRYRECDVQFRADQMLSRTSNLVRLLAESESALAEMTCGLQELDYRIAEKRRSLEMQGRTLEVKSAVFAGSQHRQNLIRRLSELRAAQAEP